ncbi:HxlR family transcriptional regulator [Eilatimonas milleporae]|uniref:HxlR family transcriptional regulator n=2 Tax=Eilatimonas milleporae TaxID=911205 RepID=A0A3M0CWB3_9PROT|nr:HxlR family transcriptional regulator [Eilatimonas milleporae]
MMHPHSIPRGIRMRRKSFTSMTCSIARAVDAIGDAWAFLILRDLMRGPCRFEDLRQSLDIPTDTLTARLKKLEQGGLIERRPYGNHARRFEYLITKKGTSLRTVMIALAHWGDRWINTDRAGPPVEIYNAATGHPVALRMVDSVTGEDTPPSQILSRPGPGADDALRRALDAALGTAEIPPSPHVKKGLKNG